MPSPNPPDPSASPSASAERERLLDLVGAAIERLHESGESAMREFCAGLPEFGDKVLQRIAALRAVGLIDGVEAPAEVPDRLGDFELLERLGVGGMGVVHRARQVSIERDVALKLVKPEQLYFPGVRERFQREIAVVARLRHEGIVQLYSFGEDRGIPWFAMERIVGVSLADVLVAFETRTPRELTGAELFRFVASRSAQVPFDAPLPELFEGSWVDVVTRIGARMARAMAYAHGQGVLHRDLKPSNVMVTIEGRVVLLDFGLALSRGVDRLTRTGAQLGSVHYMAPEQVRGDAAAVDERTDVYALGVVLYELLALSPAFDGEFADEVVRRILDASPTPLTTRNPAVTWDLETVCMTAMDPEPARRYPSATALQRDLHNVLERRTIEARRPGLGIRVRRWAQRHRALASALGVTFVAMVLAPVAIALRERGLRIELEQTVQERDREMERARNNVDLAAESLNRVLSRIETDQLTDVVDLRAYCEATLADTSALLDALVESNPTDPGARIKLAETLGAAANLRRGFVDLDRATLLFQRVLQLVAALEDDPDGRVLACKVDALNGIAGIAAQQRRPLDAEAAYRSLLDAVGDRTTLHERSLAVQAGVSQALRRLTGYDRRAVDGGLAMLEEAFAIRQRIAAGTPTSEAWLARAEAATALQNAVRRAGDTVRAEALGEDVAAALRHAADLASSTVTDELQLVRMLIDHVRRRQTAAAWDDAAVFIDLAEQRLVPLLETSGSRATVHHDLWDLGILRAAAFEARGDVPGAIAALDAARAIAMRALSVWPGMFEAHRADVFILRRICLLASQGPDRAELLPGRLAELDERAERFAAKFGQFAVVNLDASRSCIDLARFALADADVDRIAAFVERGRAHHLAAVELADAQKVGVVRPIELDLLEIEIALRRGQNDVALTHLRDVKKWLNRTTFEYAPSLRDRIDTPGFAEVLEPLRALVR